MIAAAPEWLQNLTFAWLIVTFIFFIWQNWRWRKVGESVRILIHNADAARLKMEDADAKTVRAQRDYERISEKYRLALVKIEQLEQAMLVIPMEHFEERRVFTRDQLLSNDQIVSGNYVQREMERMVDSFKNGIETKLFIRLTDVTIEMRDIENGKEVLVSCGVVPRFQHPYGKPFVLRGRLVQMGESDTIEQHDDRSLGDHRGSDRVGG